MDADDGSASGFESDAADVVAVDWTLPRPDADGDGAGDAPPPATTALPPPPDEAAAATTSDWASEDDVDSDAQVDADEDEDEDDEEEDEDEFEDGDSDAEDEEADAAADADASDEEGQDRPVTPTHARLLALAYTVGSRVAGAARVPTAQAAQPASSDALAAAAPAAAAAAAAAALGRRPLQCAIVPLPAPPKPPHPPLLHQLDAAVAGVCPPRGRGGDGGGAAAAALDRHGAPLSACRRALRQVGRGRGRGASAATTSAVDDDDEDEDDGRRGGGSSDDGEEDEDEDEDEEEEAEEPTPQRRSARLAAAARGGGGDDDDQDDDEDARGARDQQQQQQQQRPSPSRRHQRAAKRRAASASANATAKNNGGRDSLTVLNTARLLLKRDLGLGAGGGGAFSRAQRLHASALPPRRALPTRPCCVRDEMASRAYVGQFSADGSMFVAAYQDRRVRLYDVCPVGRGGGGGGGRAGDDDHEEPLRGHGGRGGRRGGGGGGGGGASASRSSTSSPSRWRLRKDLSTNLLRWTVTDTALSPDGRYLVYSSITPVVWLVDVGAPFDAARVDSRANETQLHDALSFAPPLSEEVGRAAEGGGAAEIAAARAMLRAQNFGIWSVAWAQTKPELVAGTSERSALVYDMGAGRPVARMAGHGDDVNAVAHLDPLSPNLVATGSDDALVRLWDRRVGAGGAGGQGGVASARRAAAEAAAGGGGAPPPAGGVSSSSAPVGVWLGHTEGVTHLCPRGDGRLLLSNAKDQTARIWDARVGLRPPNEARALPAVRGGKGCGYDYRWEAYPYRGHDVRHPHDSSVQVFRGHSVLQSLVRAYFSPEASTGGRYVYAGSADGAAVIWDAASAEVVARLSGAHGAVVRDASWHPGEASLVTSSWDGRLVEWRAPGSGGGGLYDEDDDEGN